MKKIIPSILLIICSLTFIYSLIKIINYSNDDKKILEQIKEINNMITIESDDTTIEVEGNQNINTNQESSKINPYTEYTKLELIDVDLNNLQRFNRDTKGWIKLNGTSINYPFVQTTDNKYYLTHSFDKSENVGGWVFLDYRNNINFLEDKNTIIYGHGMKSGTMFGSLKDTLSSKWQSNKDNFFINLSTSNYNTLWQVFSIYHIENTSDYIKTYFKNDNDFQNFLNNIIKRSDYNFNQEISTKDQILTLSTCYDYTERLVLHAKLIKKESKNN